MLLLSRTVVRHLCRCRGLPPFSAGCAHLPPERSSCRIASTIHCLAVMLLTISTVSEQIIEQGLSTTWFKVLNTSLLNPIERSCFQICSMGFISGAYGGMCSNDMFPVTLRPLDLCQEAPSHTGRMRSSGYALDNSSRNTFMQTVSHLGSASASIIRIASSFFLPLFLALHGKLGSDSLRQPWTLRQAFCNKEGGENIVFATKRLPP